MMFKKKTVNITNKDDELPPFERNAVVTEEQKN